MALRLLLMDLIIKVAGEAADWSATLAQVHLGRIDMLLVDWGLLSNKPIEALQELREVCPAAIIMVLIDHPDARQQASISDGGGTFLCKDEPPDHLVERLRAVTELLPPD